MQAWQSAIQLLQVHLLELDPARKLAAATSAELLSRACSNVNQLRQINLSSTEVGQMLQAEVRTWGGLCCELDAGSTWPNRGNLQHNGGCYLPSLHIYYTTMCGC